MSQPDLRSRAAAIVRGLSLAEKIALLSGADWWHTVGVPSADVPSVMMADGPHGLRKEIEPANAIGFAPSEPATCFPSAATLAGSWDPQLAEEVGRAIGEEARCQGVAMVLGPGLNLKRHPCCGRNFEYFSEDPLLSGKMAAGLVRGIQSTGVAACVKHLAANNQAANQMVVDAVVDERTLRELYLAGFEIAVRESAPQAAMSAYNRLNGEYCSESRRLLTGILRAEWGFDGLVVSDWGAVNDRVAGLKAGLDLEMPGGQSAHDARVRTAIAEGTLPEDALDQAAARVIEFALEAAASASPAAPFDVDAHHALARRVASESAVLLANDGILPLTPAGRIAVIGAMAAHPRFQGGGSSLVSPTRLDNALDAIRNRTGDSAEITYVAAYEDMAGELVPRGLDDAVRAAGAADVAVVFVGLPPIAESEGFDRDDMRLPEGHDALVQAVCEANPRTVVVLSNGSSVEIPWAKKPAAILDLYFGGQAGGSAAADVLFGDAEPAGRLAETFPLALADVPSDANFPGGPRQVQYREGLFVGYRYFTTAEKPVRYPFGHGLSYTMFEFGEPRLSAERISADESVELRVPVTNVGSRRGATVVQAYVHDVASPVRRPARELAGFTKLWLEPGETAEAVIELTPRAFAFYDVASASWAIEGGEFEVLVGMSSADIVGRASLRIESDFAASPSSAPRNYVADDAEFAEMLGKPVPVPESRLPYHANSIVSDLRQTRLGRLVETVMMRSIEQRLAGLGDVDPGTRRMVETFALGMPLRALATMEHVGLSWRGLALLLDALNGRWLRALRDLFRRHE